MAEPGSLKRPLGLKASRGKGVGLVGLIGAAFCFWASGAQAQPTGAAIKDADTRAWWTMTGDLSADAMEGRDTGSKGYARAARYVVDRFKAAGLKPAGDDGQFAQTVPLHEVRLEPTGTTISVVSKDGAQTKLIFLHDISVRATEALPEVLDAPMSFRGYCSKAEMGEDMRGKVAVCFGGRRRGVPSAAERLTAAAGAGAVGVIAVDDPGFTIEPARWPDAYARTVSIKGSLPPAQPRIAVMRLSAAVFAAVIGQGGPSPARLLLDGSASRPLPAFDLPGRLHATFQATVHDYTSDNVLGLLPGVDPALSAQVIVVSAHLDGYGFGEAVNGDSLYNGAFDDAAYVATLMRFAQRRQGRGLKRSVLFAAFTGEEKGLLGATWFTQHPTVPRADLVADINLDQLRPLFPLRILTMHAVNDTTLGASAKKVAGAMNIAIRPDLEPERNLVQRADHWPFLKIGVPATGFVFGYDPNTSAEMRYRQWYQVRYHRPQDDMTQPIDFQAAADFNLFFYRLTEEIANTADRPSFLADSPFKPAAGTP